MIRVNANEVVRKQENFWNHIHFHPTDAIEDDWGRRILDEVAKDNVAQTVRMYAMLEDIVSMDDQGNLCYDYTECDARIDYMLSKGFNLLLSYNFIPKCLAIDPDEGSTVAKNKKFRYKGKTICASPPRDYAQWEEVCYQFTKHIVERYGEEEVSKWYLQCFNEPDLPLFFMKYEEDQNVRVENYLQLYRGFSRAICRVSEKLKAGGPALANNNVFLADFLRAVKAKGLKFDYFCCHVYGTSPRLINEGVKPMHIQNNIRRLEGYWDTLRRCGYEDIEIVVDEWGMSTAGFHNREECPTLMMREDSRFAAYFGKLITGFVYAVVKPSKMMICLSGQHEMVTDFSGFRGFFTLSFIKKPIYNAYVLAAKLHENLLKTTHDRANMELLGTSNESGDVSVMVSYASEYFVHKLPDLEEQILVEGVNGKYQVTLWCIDENHTNPYLLMLRENMQEDNFSKEDLARLQQEGCLKPMEQYEIDADGSVSVNVKCTNNALVLAELKKL